MKLSTRGSRNAAIQAVLVWQRRVAIAVLRRGFAALRRGEAEVKYVDRDMGCMARGEGLVLVGKKVVAGRWMLDKTSSFKSPEGEWWYVLASMSSLSRRSSSSRTSWSVMLCLLDDEGSSEVIVLLSWNRALGICDDIFWEGSLKEALKVEAMTWASTSAHSSSEGSQIDEL